jgi:hypothetical protein
MNLCCFRRTELFRSEAKHPSNEYLWLSWFSSSSSSMPADCRKKTVTFVRTFFLKFRVSLVIPFRCVFHV